MNDAPRTNVSQPVQEMAAKRDLAWESDVSKAAERSRALLRSRTVSLYKGNATRSKARLYASASSPALTKVNLKALNNATSVPALQRLTPRQQQESANRLSRLPDHASPRTSDAGSPRFSVGSSASSQDLNMRRCAPSYGFGAASRDTANKLFISQQHTLSIMHGRESPGPARYKAMPHTVSVPRFAAGHRFLFCGKLDKKPPPGAYRIPSLLDPKQPDGSHANAPMWTMGSSTRDQMKNVFVSQQHTMTIRAGTQSPGPIYDLPKTVGGKQPNARVRDTPSYTIAGKARTPVDARGCKAPGPIYHLPKTVGGKQPDAAHRSEPSWTIASKSRTPVDAGISSPGPIYNLPSASGRQPRAGKRSAPTPSFSRYSRFADVEREQRKNSVPGPGYYG